MQDQDRNCKNWDILLQAKQIKEGEFILDRYEGLNVKLITW